MDGCATLRKTESNEEETVSNFEWAEPTTMIGNSNSITSCTFKDCETGVSVIPRDLDKCHLCFAAITHRDTFETKVKKGWKKEVVRQYACLTMYRVFTDVKGRVTERATQGSECLVK